MRPPIRELCFRELEREICRKTGPVAPCRFTEALGEHVVEFSQVGIEHDLLTANEENAALDQFNRNRKVFGGGTALFFAIRMRA